MPQVFNAILDFHLQSLYRRLAKRLLCLAISPRSAETSNDREVDDVCLLRRCDDRRR